MKKLCILCGLLLLLSGCQAAGTGSTPAPTASAPPAPTATAEPTPTTAPTPKPETIKAAKASAKKEGWSTVQDCTYDFDQDGNMDTVTLYTSAEMEKGKFLWEDRQEWLLEVKTDQAAYYPLYQGAVSNGNVYFIVSELYKEATVPAVSLLISAGADLSFKQYTFEKEQFSGRTIYSAAQETKEGINTLYASLPFYE